MDTSGESWIKRYAAEVGIPPPSASEIEMLLELAGSAAHSSERIAAPITCWLAARAGLTPETALVIARRLAESLTSSDQIHD